MYQKALKATTFLHVFKSACTILFHPFCKHCMKPDKNFKIPLDLSVPGGRTKVTFFRIFGSGHVFGKGEIGLLI